VLTDTPVLLAVARQRPADPAVNHHRDAMVVLDGAFHQHQRPAICAASQKVGGSGLASSRWRGMLVGVLWRPRTRLPSRST